MSRAFLLFCAFAVLGSVGRANTVELKVVDRASKPVEGAEGRIYFLTTDSRITNRVDVRTSAEGNARAEATATYGFNIAVAKPGYYSAFLDHLPLTDRLEQTVVLPAIRNPIPLMARKVNPQSGPGARIPALDTWMDFDFERGDWLPPYGSGQTSDIRFRFTQEFVGYPASIRDLEEEKEVSKLFFAARGEEWTEEAFRRRTGLWRGELAIAFPNDGEGLVEVRDEFLPYSRLKMPHEAPVGGFQPTWRYLADDRTPSDYRMDVGFFLRIRVQRDAMGAITSAHYVKLMGDILLDPSGSLGFAYYFNPTPGDRNLEFDPERNLLPPTDFSERVTEP